MLINLTTCIPNSYTVKLPQNKGLVTYNFFGYLCSSKAAKPYTLLQWWGLYPPCVPPFHSTQEVQEKSRDTVTIHKIT